MKYFVTLILMLHRNRIRSFQHLANIRTFRCFLSSKFVCRSPEFSYDDTTLWWYTNDTNIAHLVFHCPWADEIERATETKWVTGVCRSGKWRISK